MFIGNPSDIKVVYRSRKVFYEGKDIYWYEFWKDDERLDYIGNIGKYFLRVPTTNYFEYAGSLEESIKDLNSYGITDIVQGNEL